MAYTEVKTSVVIEAAKRIIKEYQDRVDREREELAVATLEWRNKWRGRFFMKPITLDQAKKDLAKAGTWDSPWRWIAYSGGHQKQHCELLLHAAEVSHRETIFLTEEDVRLLQLS